MPAPIARLADNAIAWLHAGLREPPETRRGLRAGMIDRRALLAAGASLPGRSPALAQGKPAPASSLRALAAAKGLLFGTAAANYELKDADFVAALTRDAAILVPEYEMKRHVRRAAARALMIFPPPTS